MSLHHYRIPRENLLNKIGDVTPDGRYVTPYKVTAPNNAEILCNYFCCYKDSSKQHGASLGPLSSGRIAILSLCVGNLKCAITIAVRYARLTSFSHTTTSPIRYSAVRKQFGPSSGEEVPVLEYQLQV